MISHTILVLAVNSSFLESAKIKVLFEFTKPFWNIISSEATESLCAPAVK
tara:strand:- start:2862 stop:3011 length:150 start_codon:yes stop_codon:yes gene_type:complete